MSESISNTTADVMLEEESELLIIISAWWLAYELNLLN